MIKYIYLVTGYYRVKYEQWNWQIIADYLNSNEYTNIHTCSPSCSVLCQILVISMFNKVCILKCEKNKATYIGKHEKGKLTKFLSYNRILPC